MTYFGLIAGTAILVNACITLILLFELVSHRLMHGWTALALWVAVVVLSLFAAIILFYNPCMIYFTRPVYDAWAW